ncbi:hypothetical protein V5799_016307 [Amblyomma americanum]|uniref:Uncharacterized protein n=1 Tax=Amblyomma americanum TaxID=6943 RepID=A0AAQ4F651_AMBAM
MHAVQTWVQNSGDTGNIVLSRTPVFHRRRSSCGLPPFLTFQGKKGLQSKLEECSFWAKHIFHRNTVRPLNTDRSTPRSQSYHRWKG